MIELQLHQNWGHFYSLLLKGCALLLLSACLPIEGISRHLVSTKVESKANSWLMITGLPLGYLMDNHNPWETVWTNPPEALTSANDLSTTIAGTLGIAESAECDCLDGEVTFWQDSGYLRDSRSAYIIKNGWMTMTMHVFWAPLPFDLWENRQFQKISTLLSPASLFPTSMAPRGGRVFLCSKGHPFLPVFRSWPKGPKADSIMDGFDASLGSFQVLLQVFAASIQQLEHPGSWNSRRPCLEAVLGWWWCLSLELQWGV